jgi:hypothetical protein
LPAAEALIEYGDRHNLSFTAENVEDLLQGSVTLGMTASVHSKQLLQWRGNQPAPLRVDDYVAGDSLGRLGTPPSSVMFNLGPKLTRTQSIVEAAAVAHEVAVPFFELFRRSSNLIERLVEQDIPGFSDALAFDYVLCFGGRQEGT